MSLDTTRNILLRLFAECGGKTFAPEDWDFPLLTAKMGVTARDLAYVFLRMKQQYSCNLNPVVAALTTYSVNDISQAFQRELSSNE